MSSFCTPEQWCLWDPNPRTRAAVSGDGGAALLGPRLQFGTAGLRGPMGAGSACMNDLTVLWATQGLAAHLQRTLGDVRSFCLYPGMRMGCLLSTVCCLLSHPPPSLHPRSEIEPSR